MALSKRIVVNLNRQTLTAFEGNKEVFFFDCVTGDKDNLTPPGSFKIYRMHRNYVSRQYNRQMNYAMFIYRGIAIHQAYVVGASSYLKMMGLDFGLLGSHGCIRLKEEDARTLFDWSSKGLPVEVIKG